MLKAVSIKFPAFYRSIKLLIENSPFYIDFNEFLHACRSEQLRKMPKGAKVFLSAGCAGKWYFDWVNENYGPVDKHIGIEYYAPKPDDLPSNVHWIKNTVSDMSAVEDNSADIVFSGQNIEHLWPEEVVGFLLESWRVLRNDGYLIIDSPNREITRALNWSHPEHTIEYDVNEAKQLASLSGFDVKKIAGLWTCRNPLSGKLLTLWSNYGFRFIKNIRNLIGRSRPRLAFVWWLEARKSERLPDEKGLKQYVSGLVAELWAERVNWLQVLQGRKYSAEDGNYWIHVEEGITGIIVYGPYIPLRAGDHRVRFSFKDIIYKEKIKQPFARIEIMIAAQQDPIASTEVYQTNNGSSEVPFSLRETQFGVQFRVFSYGTCNYNVKLSVDLDDGLPPLSNL